MVGQNCRISTYTTLQPHSTRSTMISCCSACRWLSALVMSPIGGFGPTFLAERSVFALEPRSHPSLIWCVESHKDLFWVLYCSFCTPSTSFRWSKVTACRLTYADDRQVYGSCRPADVVSFSSGFSRCVDETSGWMKSNRLQSNPEKAAVLQAKSVCDLGIYRVGQKSKPM